MPVAHIFTNDGLTVAFNGFLRQIRSDSPMFSKVVSLIKEKASDDLIAGAMDLAAKIKGHASGLFSVADDGIVYIAGEALPNSLSKRIVQFATEGFDFQPLVTFWENCKLNPDPRAKSDLYNFLEHNGIPITSDGCFIGYRAVKNDWYDKRTGTMLNTVGSVLTMNRADCDSDPNQTCSRGLHVAAYNYARHNYGSSGDRLLEVKVNPADVVAIPTDYNGEKMRVCKFVVMAENQEGVIARPVYDPDNVPQDDDSDWDDEDDYDNEEGAVSTAGPVPAPVTVAGGTDAWKSQPRLSNGRFARRV
jgi:hypothetical protein